eukprot:3265671-Prymnesium_polylepis.1
MRATYRTHTRGRDTAASHDRGSLHTTAARVPSPAAQLTIYGDDGKTVNVRDLIIAGLYSVLAIASVFGLVRVRQPDSATQLSSLPPAS